MTYLKHKNKEWDELADSTRDMLRNLKVASNVPKVKKSYHCQFRDCGRELLKPGKYCLDHAFIEDRRRAEKQRES